ncbi:MAG: sialidase family protein [Desulfovibrionaceae bacterium]
MPSISGDEARHVTIDHLPGRYRCFPDVVRARSGRLVCAYQDYDKHAAEERSLLVRTSDDGGRTWTGPRVLDPERTHCPRLTLLEDGTLYLMDDNLLRGRTSADEGETWSEPLALRGRMSHVLADRVLSLPGGGLLSAAHAHRGRTALARLGQPPCEVAAFRSEDGGKRFGFDSIIHSSAHLALCEPSLCLLPGNDDGAPPLLAALLRENSLVYEPMYLCLSRDLGRTWTDPAPTPLVGHRPTLGRTASGKLLVTYRDVGPDPGTAAWLGTLEELAGPYLVHGRVEHPETVRFEGLNNGEAAMFLPAGAGARWALRPMTDPATARAELTLALGGLEGEGPAAALRLGCGWRVVAGSEGRARIEAMGPDGARRLWRKLPPGRVELRLTYTPGLVTLRINGRKRAEVAVDAQARATRAILLGTPTLPEGEDGPGTPSAGSARWLRAALRIDEPRRMDTHAWDWRAAEGPLHAHRLARVLELENDHAAHYGDFGYSGWCETSPGEFFCAYHHGGGLDQDYEPGWSARVRGAFFSEADFG